MAPGDGQTLELAFGKACAPFSQKGLVAIVQSFNEAVRRRGCFRVPIRTKTDKATP